MKKKIIILCSILIVCALISGIWFLRGRPFTEIGYRLYPFSRMTCTVQLTVDGKPCPLNESMVGAGLLSGGAENTIRSFEQTETGGIVKCRGGAYGGQPFLIYLNTADGKPVTFYVIPVVANWWEISEITLDLSVDSSTNSYTAKYHYVVYDEENGGSKNDTLNDENFIKISSI